MRFILLFVCALALFATVSTKPCWDYSCSGGSSSSGFAEQFSYSASGHRSQSGYSGGNYNNGGRFGNSGSGGFSGGGGQRSGGGSGYGNRRHRNCPTCGVSNFGNGNNNHNKITIRRNYG